MINSLRAVALFFPDEIGWKRIGAVLSQRRLGAIGVPARGPSDAQGVPGLCRGQDRRASGRASRPAPALGHG